MKFILLLLATVSVLEALSDRVESNNTCWTQLPCETASTLQTQEKSFNHKCEESNTRVRSQMDPQMDQVECYPWMYYNQEQNKCKCSKIPYRSLLCDADFYRPPSILDCYCMTHDQDTNQTQLGRCLYGCGHKIDTVYYPLPNTTKKLNDYSCGKYNRDSVLCGECLQGFSPLLYSYDMKCINCTGQNMTYNWIRYIAIAYVPLTIFFFFVVIFNFNGTSPMFKSFITISQGMFSPMVVRATLSVVSKKYVDTFIRIVGCFYGIWNLDFCRTVIPPICMTGMTNLQILALDYAVAFYPLVLILISYFFISMHSRDVRIIVCLWKPFRKLFRSCKQNWDLEGSIVKSFATFFLLSYLKIINVTFDLLVFTEVFVINNSSNKDFETKKALYYDGSVEYFGKEHLPYAILALFIGTFVGILPLVFLFVYPMKWFQRCLNIMKIQRQGVETFVNCYQGYYRDGTNGTRDYRWFSIIYFVLQLTLFILFMISRSIYAYTFGSLIIMTMMFVQFSLQPYKEEFKTYNTLDCLILLNVAAVFIMAIAGDEADTKAVYFVGFSYGCVAILSLLPLVYILAVAIWWLVVKKNLKNLCKRKLLRFRIRSQETSIEATVDGLPHRLANPIDYTAGPGTPLLSGPSQGAQLVDPTVKVIVPEYGAFSNTA